MQKDDVREGRGAFPASLSRGARLLRALCALKPGEALRVDTHTLMDCEVPADPLTQQTKEFLVGWFRDRLPFRSEVQEVPTDGALVFFRPAAPSAAQEVKGE